MDDPVTRGTNVSVSLSTKSNEPLVNNQTEPNRSQTVNAKALEIDQHKESNNPLPDFISFFKAKLKDRQQNCLCQCCTLWIAVHIAMICLFWFTIEAIINTIQYFQSGNFFIGSIMFIFVFVESICFIFAFRGLYRCDTRGLFAQYIFLWIVWIALIEFILNIIVNSITTVDLVGHFISIILQIYCILIFRRVYLWAKYFKNGGTYDKAMMTPNNDTKCHLC